MTGASKRNSCGSAWIFIFATKAASLTALVACFFSSSLVLPLDAALAALGYRVESFEIALARIPRRFLLTPLCSSLACAPTHKAFTDNDPTNRPHPFHETMRPSDEVVPRIRHRRTT